MHLPSLFLPLSFQMLKRNMNVRSFVPEEGKESLNDSDQTQLSLGIFYWTSESQQRGGHYQHTTLLCGSGFSWRVSLFGCSWQSFLDALMTRDVFLLCVCDVWIFFWFCSGARVFSCFGVCCREHFLQLYLYVNINHSLKSNPVSV